MNCNNSLRKKNIIIPKSNPYEVFFSSLKAFNLSDTILVQSQTKIFGCGTAAHEYHEKLKKEGLDKFYEKYGTVFSDTTILKKFEKENKTKVLWVFRGYEGELMEFENEKLKKNKKLFDRLLKEKDFIQFSETPNSMISITFNISKVNPKKQETEISTYTVDLKDAMWGFSLVNQENFNGENFKRGYYPF